MDCICWTSVLDLDYTIDGHFTVKSILQGKGSDMAGKIRTVHLEETLSEITLQRLFRLELI